MKTLLSTLLLGTMLTAPALATDASSNATTSTHTTVNTTQDSGISLSGKSKIMPKATVSTGDNAATTDVRTSVDTTTDVRARPDRRSAYNHSDRRERGRGHKYGHDR